MLKLTNIFVKTHLLKKIVFLILLSSCFFIPFSIEAIAFDNPLTATTFEELIGSLVDFIFWVAVAIAPIMILVGGFYFLTAAGDPQKIQTAKKIILWTIIGFVIVLLAKGIISMLEQILGG